MYFSLNKSEKEIHIADLGCGGGAISTSTLRRYFDALIDDQLDDYKYATSGKSCFGSSCSAYEQVIWADTLEVGCGYSTCSGDVFFVCHGVAGSAGFSWVFTGTGPPRRTSLGASIRIPVGTVEDGWKGRLEDRRPASNADPYKVAAAIIKTTKEAF